MFAPLLPYAARRVCGSGLLTTERAGVYRVRHRINELLTVAAEHHQASGVPKSSPNCPVRPGLSACPKSQTAAGFRPGGDSTACHQMKRRFWCAISDSRKHARNRSFHYAEAADRVENDPEANVRAWPVHRGLEHVGRLQMFAMLGRKGRSSGFLACPLRAQAYSFTSRIPRKRAGPNDPATLCWKTICGP